MNSTGSKLASNLEMEEETLQEIRGERSETILVVEDDDDVRIYSTESLLELGYSVLESADGASALRMLERHPEVNLLFTDVGLPGMNGRELVEQARQRRPGLRVLFTTGYARNAIVHQGRLDPGVDLLTKPFTRAQLAMRIREVLEAPPVVPAGRIALLVEDEPLVRKFLATALEKFGFEVVEAATAREGLAAAERIGQVQVAIVDIGLPDRSGLELTTDLRTKWPTMRIVVTSGYGQRALGRFKGDTHVTFLSKPFENATIAAALEQLGFG